MIHGVLNINKEAGYTSHDVVAKLRGLLRQKRIGHTGTLDPDAIGVLPVCLGRATRLAERIGGETKVYETTVLLGRETDTQDTSGEVVATSDVTATEEEITACLQQFLGEQDQIPPMYSAKKIDGKRLYQLAREGVEVERKPHRITVHALEVLSWDLPRFRMRVTCSKGTYVRTLCHDIGRMLGCGGCMEQLTRVRVGNFPIEEAHTLAEIEAHLVDESWKTWLLPPQSFFPNVPSGTVTAEAEAGAHNGNGISAKKIRTQENNAQSDGAVPEQFLLYDTQGTFLGLYAYRANEQKYYPEIFFYGA